MTNTIANQVAAQVSSDIAAGTTSAAAAYDECYYAFRMATRDNGLDLPEHHIAHYAKHMADLAIARA